MTFLRNIPDGATAILIECRGENRAAMQVGVFFQGIDVGAFSAFLSVGHIHEDYRADNPARLLLMCFGAGADQQVHRDHPEGGPPHPAAHQLHRGPGYRRRLLGRPQGPHPHGRRRARGRHVGPPRGCRWCAPHSLSLDCRHAFGLFCNNALGCVDARVDALAWAVWQCLCRTWPSCAAASRRCTRSTTTTTGLPLATRWRATCTSSSRRASTPPPKCSGAPLPRIAQGTGC